MTEAAHDVRQIVTLKSLIDEPRRRCLHDRLRMRRKVYPSRQSGFDDCRIRHGPLLSAKKPDRKVGDRTCRADVLKITIGAAL
jgi:hypothetical protein